jgi:hypothetical protein
MMIPKHDVNVRVNVILNVNAQHLLRVSHHHHHQYWSVLSPVESLC